MRLTRLAISALAIGGLLVFAYRPIRITVDTNAIETSQREGLSLRWPAISRVVYVTDLASSPYKPTTKLSGVAVGAYRAGLFRTSGGREASVLAERSDRALIIESGTKLYELAPRQLDRLVTEVAKYLPVSGGPVP